MIELYDGTKVQVGYRVRSLLHGWGVVEKNHDPHDHSWPLMVQFPHWQETFTRDGRIYAAHLNPCLVEMEAPKKLVKGWVNVWGGGDKMPWEFSTGPVWPSKEVAIERAERSGYPLTLVVATIPIEFEV